MYFVNLGELDAAVVAASGVDTFKNGPSEVWDLAQFPFFGDALGQRSRKQRDKNRFRQPTTTIF